MEGEAKRSELQSLLEAIKASDVLESRISLISQLADLHRSETSDVALLVEYLVAFWEESTCSCVSQCTLNKTILQIAAKYLELDTLQTLTQFLILGKKASIWCVKHLQMTIHSIDESQDENHSSIFFQLMLDSLSFSSNAISSLTRSPILGEESTVLIIENFVSELLNLTKASIMEIKKIRPIASQAVKVAQVVLDASIKLCRTYSQAIKCDLYEVNVNGNKGLKHEKAPDNVIHIINITTCTIQILYELGTFAASDGGSLVTILNVSWKGVVSLLQLGRGILTERVNVGDIILTLISLAVESLRCISETWSMASEESLAIAEAKRAFLPIKFYLINAVRISSDYPCEAMNVYKEIIRCVLLISSSSISFSKESRLRAASEAIAEFLEPTSFLLLHTLLNSADIKSESKFLIVEWLFKDEMEFDMTIQEENIDTAAKSTSLCSIFAVDFDAILKIEALKLGQVILFLNLLKTSPALSEDMVIRISTKLENLLNVMTHEDVYSSILGLWIPVFGGFGPNPGVSWQPMFSSVIHALKTFMIVAASSSPAWMEVEEVLLQNIFSPHFLCVEIVTELWCFFMRHAEIDMINHLLDRLCLLLKIVASSEPSLTPLSVLRKMSGVICTLLSYAAPATVEQFYTSILSDDKLHLSSIMYVALLMEGFPLDLLSDDTKVLATSKMVSTFYSFMDKNPKELELNSLMGSCGSDIFGLPVHALSSALHCCHIKNSDFFDGKGISQVLKFTLSVTNGYKNSATDSMKDHHAKLLCALLDIISNSKQFYGCEDIEKVILELHSLFARMPADADASLCQCKPSLASFMAGLSHMEIAEGEGNAVCSAIWELYNVLLKERHWAFVHLAVAAFGYFAARTSCTQLWRFVPQDAALSFDAYTGKETHEDRFMIELKGFLEREGALHEVSPSKQQLSLLVKEGRVLRKLGKTLNTIPQVLVPESIQVNDDKCTKNKKRKLPDGICEGMEMLQSGLKVMCDALAQAHSAELMDSYSSHIACLEDVISHLIGLSESV